MKAEDEDEAFALFGLLVICVSLDVGDAEDAYKLGSFVLGYVVEV